jgi:branched-chain amino acid transport system substrate-binding protein
MKVGVPLVAGAFVLSGFTAVTEAGASTAPHVIPTYTLAYQGPLSQGYAALGLNMKYAMEYAIYRWDHTAGRKFNLAGLYLDDQGTNTALAQTDAHRAVSNAHVVGVVGPAFSGNTLTSQGIYGPKGAKNPMPLISPSATSPALGTAAENPDRNFNRVVADDNVQGPADANYSVNKLHQHNVYVINDNSDYGKGLADAFQKQAHTDGATTNTNTLAETSGCGGPGSTTEYSTIGALVAAAHATEVFYGGYYCDAALLIDALKTQGYSGKFMSGDGTDDPHFISDSIPPSSANGAYLTCACAAVPPTTAINRQFIAGYERYSSHQPPGTYSPESFDAVNTFIFAMNAILAAHGHITRAAIVAQLHRTVYKGITKTVKFRAYGDIAGSAIFVSQVQKGKIVQLGLE